MNLTLETARRLIRHGIKLLAIEKATKGDSNTGKKPLSRGLSDPITTSTEATAIWRGTAGVHANIAIVCSRVGGMICVDIDSYKHPEAENWRVRHHEMLIDAGFIAERTGGGGWHYWCLHPGPEETVASGDICKGVTIMADGGAQGLGHYAVISPSTHWSGNTYDWESISLPDALDAGIVAVWPATLPWLQIGAKSTIKTGIVLHSQRTATTDMVQALVTRLNRITKDTCSSRHHTMLAWVLEAVALGVDDDTVFETATAWLAREGRGPGEQPDEVANALAEAHNRLDNGTGISVSPRYVPEVALPDLPPEGDGSVVTAADAKFVSDVQLVAVPSTDVSWLQALDINPVSKKICNTTRNAATVVAGLNFGLGYNEYIGSMRWRAAPPWDPARHIEIDGSAVLDDDESQLQVYLSSFRIEIAKDKMRDAMIDYAKRRPYHPVKAYLESITWDGVSRLDHWATVYCGALNPKISNLLCRKWLISAIARIYRPGCLADYMLVFEGPQGCFKTSLLRVLGGRFFGELTSSLDGSGLRDAVESNIGKWIIEIGELDMFRKTDVTRWKAFLTRTTDRVRLAYDRRTQDYPRSNVCAGTTNDAQYLHDPSGARRIWPLRVTKIDLAALIRDRDQIWAEALALYRAGELWYVDRNTHPELYSEIELEQEARQVRDAWDQEITNYLEVGMGKHLPAVTFGDIWTEILGGNDASSLGRGEQHRIRESMQRLGWSQGHAVNASGVSVRSFIRPKKKT